MKLIFQDNISESIKKVVEDLIANNKETNGNITVEYIPEDEVEDYDLPTSITKNADEIYNVTQCVCGAWDQPLTMVAVIYWFWNQPQVVIVWNQELTDEELNQVFTAVQAYANKLLTSVEYCK